MGTIRHYRTADTFQFRSGTAFPQLVKADGTNFPVSGLAYDATTEETAYLPLLRADAYGSGDWTIWLNWYALAALTGGVAFGVSLAAVTPNTDTIDFETKGFATETIITDTHLGTTIKRSHDVIGALSNLDSMAINDIVVVRIARKVADAGDTIAGDIVLTAVTVTYSDT